MTLFSRDSAYLSSATRIPIPDTSTELILVAKSPTVQNFNFTLPANLQRGFYTVLASAFNEYMLHAVA